MLPSLDPYSTVRILLPELGPTMNDYQTIRYQRHGDIGTLTLARPGKRNAQNPLMWQEWPASVPS